MDAADLGVSRLPGSSAGDRARSTVHAVITQRGARVTINLRSPTISALGGPAGEFEVPGTLEGDTLSFVIAGDTNYGDFSSVDFSDQLSPTQSLGIAASAQGTVTRAEI